MQNQFLSEWRKLPARHLFTFRRGYPIGRGELGAQGIPCIHYGDIHGEFGFSINLETALIGRLGRPNEYGIENYVSEGDFLFAGTSEDFAGSGNFTLVVGSILGIAGSDTIVLSPKGPLNSYFFAYFFDSLYFREQIRPHMMGTKVFHPTQRVIKQAICLLPPDEVASKIVSYLDDITGTIAESVSKLERERELLEQYRRELIARTVTRGLDPDVPMRDSALGWVDNTPEHWEELRIGSLYDLRSEKVRDVDYPPLSVTMNGILPQLEHVAKTNDNDNRKLIRAGDFVINSRSDRRGACGIADRDGSCSLINLVLTPSTSIHNPYFSYLLRSSRFADEFYRWGHGIHNDLWTTNWSDMKSIRVPVPPVDEQEQIAEFLDGKMAELDSTIAGIDKQIELLGRYRKQVINDVVTGKVRVGEVA